MTKIRFLGDIHGNFDAWKYLTQGDFDLSIQVGDMGCGFGIPLPSLEEVPLKNKFIRGNHDNPALCKEDQRYIPDGTFWEKEGIMFIGGADSIDKHHRTEGKDWWRDEELSLSELYRIYDVYCAARPRVLVVHDCPHTFAVKTFWGLGNQPIRPTRTSAALDEMLNVHKPLYCFFGHWHQSVRKTIDGTTFICLNINEAVDLTIGENND